MATLGKASAPAALMGILLLSAPAHALSPADKCEASKLGTAGKYDFCRLKAEAKAVKTGGAPDFTKCDPKFSAKWTQAETNAGGACPSDGDEAAIQTFITEHANALEAALDGGTLPEGVLSCNADLATCNGNLSTCSANDTACNGNLSTCTENLAACLAGQSALPKTGQTTSFGTGSDGDLQKGASRSFTDNGDGTITDNTTGLMWEKKDESVGIHHWLNSYAWGQNTSPYAMNGTMVTTFLAALNTTPCFAGYCDWRIPNVNELQGLVDYQTVFPAIDLTFNNNCASGCTVTNCSCTMSGSYWSSTTAVDAPTLAWAVLFNVGSVIGTTDKSTTLGVRAVRGGS